ncbi:MAG: Protein-glutamate methylesterase/protein-glutamine glutaminase [Pseudomonadota bacterium]|jgi:two-component system chemotaxis response regulator CheB
MTICTDILLFSACLTERQKLLRVISQLSEVHCLGTATTATLALRKVELLKPDVVLIDEDMLTETTVPLLTELKQQYPHLNLILLAYPSPQQITIAVQTQQLGILDVIVKPQLDDNEAEIKVLINQLQPLIDLVQLKKQARLSQSPPLIRYSHPIISGCSNHLSAFARRKFSAIELIVIGLSTGGPKALHRFIPELDSSLPCPLLIVQHMPPVFTEALADKLNDETALSVCEVKGGEEIQPGHIYLAQGGKHLVLTKSAQGKLILELNELAPVNYCRPSVDVLFESVANIFSGQVLAIVMTGMGHDGTEGVRCLKRRGALCWIQDQASSVVWGMPGSVHAAGLADEVLALEDFAQRINQVMFESGLCKALLR